MTDDWKIALSGKNGEGKFALVDEDTFRLYGHLKWHLSDSGYVMRRGKYDKDKVHTVRLHRLVIEATEGMDVDHRNGDRLDNRRSNLWEVTRSINGSNRASTGYYKTRSGSYAVKSRGRHVGTFYNTEDARAAFKVARDKFNIPTRFKETS